jgi:hypothetical protein
MVSFLLRLKMHKSVISSAGLALILGTCLTSTASSPLHAAKEAAASCSSASYHAMDFRVGSFTGITLGGLPAGRSEVKKILSGCALIEHWDGAISGSGMGFYYWNPSDERWHLRYVNDDGQILEFEGVADKDGISFTGSGRFYDYIGQHHMRWERVNADQVRQIWHYSNDDGRNWNSVVKIDLTRSPPKQPADG